MCTVLNSDLYCTDFKCPHNLFWEKLNLERDKIQMTDKVPIPLIPATRSEGSRPAVPIESGHLFRFIAATPSERSDAGV